ncbi:MAG: glycoside hydrolase family 28 protein [Xanthobacteraceae bacterium]
MKIRRRELLGFAAVGLVGAGAATGPVGPVHRSSAFGADLRTPFDVRSFGATADGKTIDTPAVNRAIAAAAAAGGGIVRFGAGVYVCYSIRLKSLVTLYLEPGTIILAAPGGGYDAAESNAPFESYQDFGHNHWHNSLIWGDGIHDVAIFGPGLICGRGLSRGEATEDGRPRADAPGAADKAIALKRCQNVTVRDIAILAAGHFGILATGVDNLTLKDLKIDTNRDGINVDCCKNVRISKCSVNSPWDDGICLKSSFALGEARATENVTISDCYLTGGFALGTMLDGTLRRTDADAGQPTGRIKCGTESNGGFRNITISNCIFESCRGFALESVDGGPIEDITFTGVTMRDIRNAPFFLRLGARLRGPAGTGVGTFKRVRISNIICDAPANNMPAIIAGIPAHPIEDVSVSDVLMVHKGGASASLADIDPPEQEREYPEPSSFGPLPARGLLVRHAKNVEFRDIEITSIQTDARPFVWLSDVDGVDFSRLSLSPRDAVPALRLREIRNLRISGSRGLPDTLLDHVTDGRIP